jgi:membrane-associated protease RseP (regulator of RpoE activity)
VPKNEDGIELPRAKPLDRLLTAFSGPFFNILFGLVLGTVVWYYGIPQDTPKMRTVVVDTIDKSGPEYQAGLRENDVIVKINGHRFFCTWNEFVQTILFAVGKVDLDLERNGEYKTIQYEPIENPNGPASLKKERIAWPYFTPRIPIVLYPNANSPAEKAGVKDGDVLLAVNGIKVSGFDEFQSLIERFEAAPLTLKVKRAENIIEIKNLVPVLNDNIPDEEKKRFFVGVIYKNDKNLEVAHLVDDFPAAKAGVKPGDIIKKVNDKEISTVEAFKKELVNNETRPFKMTVKRGTQEIVLTLQAKHLQHYTVGIRLTVIDHPSPVEQFVKVIDLSYKSLRGIIFGLTKQAGITEEGSSLKPRNLSGPIGLGRTIFVSVYYGSFLLGIYFVVIISFALAIFNLLPLPVLDGGHMLLAAIEMIIRRPVPDVIVKVLSYAFVFLLISLMIYVSFYDVLRLVPENEKSAAATTQTEQAPSRVPAVNKEAIKDVVQAANQPAPAR